MGKIVMVGIILGFVMMIAGLSQGSTGVLFGWGLAVVTVGGIAEVVRVRRAASANRVKPWRQLDPTKYYERDF